MSAQKFVFSIVFMIEENTDRLSVELSSHMGTNTKVGIAILMRNADLASCRLWLPNRCRAE